MFKGPDARAADRVLPLLIAAVLLAGAALPDSPRAFQVLVLAAMLAALWGTGSRLADWLVPELGLLSRRVAAFTFAVGIAGLPAMWMGHFGVLRPAVFLVWTAAALLASRLIPWNAPPPETGGELPRIWGWAVRAETVLLLAAAGAVAATALVSMLRSRFEPPGIYDDISYHLSEVATWIRHGDLRMLRFSMGDSSTSFYPVLGEISSWVLIAPFGDSDAAARWTQLPFALFSFLAAAAIARRLGLPRRDAAFAAVLYAAIPHVFPFLALGAGNDHATSFFTLAAVDAGLAFARRPRPGVAVATGAALGLLLATKYIGLLYVPTLLGVLALAALAERWQASREERVPWRAILGLAGLLAATLAVTSGYTYLRNAVTAGNPVFPVPVRVLGVEIFPGWDVVLTSERDEAPEFQIDVWRFLARSKRLFGPLFPFTMLPAAVLAPLVALWRRRWPAVLALSLPLVFFVEFRFLMHDHRDNRYFLPGIALAAVAFAWLLDWIGPRTSLLRTALLAVIFFQAVTKLGIGDLREALLALALLGLGLFVEREARKPGGWGQAPPLRFWWQRRAWIAAALLALAALPLGWAVATYQRVKLANRPAPLALERLTGPDGARVHYTGLNQPYLFFGSRLQNDVQIVPRSGDLDAQYYRWGSPITEPYVPGRYRRWRRILDRLKIEFVVVVITPWADPERSWMERRTNGFRRVYADTDTEIWQVVPERQRGQGYNPRHAEPADRGRRPPGAGPGADRHRRLYPVSPAGAGEARRPALPGDGAPPAARRRGAGGGGDQHRAPGGAPGRPLAAAPAAAAARAGGR
jgi:hypothetical protein